MKAQNVQGNFCNLLLANVTGLRDYRLADLRKESRALRKASAHSLNCIPRSSKTRSARTRSTACT